jgi:serine kinase of HPr protein (carbohydrate metabolism regulator)
MPQDNLLNIHASAVYLFQYAVLILGKSGSGKSDLVLRLIENKQARLVADDRVVLTEDKGKLTASAPDNLAGLLEVRGVGIVNMPYEKKAEVALAVRLVEKNSEIERFPEDLFETFQGVSVPLIKLVSFENSAVDKIVIKLKDVLEKHCKIS